MKTKMLEKYINKEITMRDGRKAVCIAYRNRTDLDIRYEDGEIKEHVSAIYFKRGGNIYNNSKESAQKYIGVTKEMNCGVKATIVEYVKSNNITVQFEDGTIVKNVQLFNFLKGGVISPNVYSNKYIGMSKKMNCGYTATIIKFVNSQDIDVEFEDGTICEHRQLISFKNGNIKYKKPRTKKRIFIPSDKTEALKKSCVGVSIMQECGMNATCIKYINNNNLEIKFEDGTIKKIRSKNNFIKGKLKSPHLKELKLEELKNKWLGQKRTMSNGEIGKIIDFKNLSDITVRFEDGTIVYNKRVTNFDKGKISKKK